MTDFFGILSKAVLDGDQSKVVETVREALESGLAAIEILDVSQQGLGRRVALVFGLGKAFKKERVQKIYQ